MTGDDPVEAVLFDLDDTLVRYRRTGREVLAAAFESAGVDPLFPVEAYNDRYDDFLDSTDSISELRRECFAALAEERGRDPAVGRVVADAYEAERDYADVELLPGADDVLSSLSAAGYRLAVVTNAPPETQTPKLDASGVGDRVETAVFAGHEAAAKPSPDPFRVALDRLGVEPTAAVHVGNSPTSDVDGARAAGLRSVWIPDAEYGDASVESDFRLESLSDLVPPPWEAVSRGRRR